MAGHVILGGKLDQQDQFAADESHGAGRARAADARRYLGKVLYRSNFDAGFDGWTDHWSGGADHARPWGVTCSLTEETCNTGSKSLMLSTTEEFPVQHASDPMHNPATFRRMGRHDEFRYHHFSGYFALGVGGFSASWQSFRLMMDTQAWDNSQRSFPTITCLASPDGQSFRWQVNDDAGVARTIFAATGGTFVGNNENKGNMCYVRWTWDMGAHGGLGGYRELQIGPAGAGHIFDLRDFADGVTTGIANGDPGSADEAIQDSTDTIDDFRGGFNIGLALDRNTAVAGGCQLFADDIVYSASHTMAEDWA